jgi:hypothetical protein
MVKKNERARAFLEQKWIRKKIWNQVVDASNSKQNMNFSYTMSLRQAWRRAGMTEELVQKYFHQGYKYIKGTYLELDASGSPL